MKTGMHSAVAWARRNAVALLALFVALGGTGYAATAINGNQIQNATITGKKLKKDTLGGRQIKESKLRRVPRARRADSALAAATAATATTASSATTAGGAPPTGAAGGDLAGTFPNPTLAPAGPPIDVAENPEGATDPCSDPARTLVLCGTAAQHWEHGAFGAPGLQVWKDRLGQVHIRGSATISTGSTDLFLFRLPADMRPPRILGMSVVTGEIAGSFAGGTALLFIYPTGSGGSDGALRLFQQTQPTQRAVHLGELVFRTDA